MIAFRALRLGGMAIAVVATVGALPAHRAASTVSATLAPDSISGVNGMTKVVTLSADMGTTGAALGSYTVSLTWDSTVVRLDSVTPGQFPAPVVRYVNGGSVSLTQTSGGVSGAFSLAKFYFRFVSDAAGARTTIQTAFSEFNAADFTDLLPTLSAPGGVARVLAPVVIMGFTPDSLRQRVGYKPAIDLTADLSASADVALGSYTADVNWDSSIMLLDSVTAGALGTWQSNPTSAGSLRLTASDATGASGSVVAAHLYFSFVNNTYPSQTAVSLSLSEIHAASSFADLLPGVTIVNGKALIGGWLRGDFDVNDSITALDSQLILQAVVGLTSGGVPQGDADCNGALSAKDAQIVLNKVVGNNTGFCVGSIQ